MTTKDKIIDVETIDYVLNNMEYDWSEIEEELKEAIGLTLKFQKQKRIEEIEKIPANETYCLDCEAGFDEDSNECFRCDGKNIVHRKLEISREELLKTLGKKQ